jgi:hypothetical protein
MAEQQQQLSNPVQIASVAEIDAEIDQHKSRIAVLKKLRPIAEMIEQQKPAETK